MTRIALLRDALKWSQSRLASEIGMSQSRLCEIENSGRWRRSVDLLLDRIAREHGLDHLVSTVFAAPLAVPACDSPSDARVLPAPPQEVDASVDALRAAGAEGTPRSAGSP